MRSPRVRGSIAGLTTALVFLLIIVALRPGPEGQAGQKPRKPRPAGKPVAMAANLTGFTVRLGLKDLKGTAWDGEIQLSQGRLLSLRISEGSVKGKVEVQLDKIEKAFDTRVAAALNRIGIPSKQDVEALSAKLDELSALLEHVARTK